jgi:hypothetical protein
MGLIGLWIWKEEKIGSGFLVKLCDTF